MFIENLESRTLFAAAGHHVISFYGLGGAGGFGNDWMEKIADKAGETNNALVRKFGEDQGGRALKDVLRSIDRNRNMRIDKAEVAPLDIRVIGYSLGGVQAANFAIDLLKTGTVIKGYLLGVGVPIRSLVTLDPVESPLKQTNGIPNNVYRYGNYYQQRGGDTTVDVYTRTSPAIKVRTITVDDPFDITGDTLTSSARRSRQVRIDTEAPNETASHKVEDNFDGRIKGRNVNHGTVPFFAYDLSLLDMTS